MVVVPPGSFQMGSPSSESGRSDDEDFQHPVTIGRAFAVGQFHVTVDQFATFVADTGYDAGSKCWTMEEGKPKERDARSWRNPGFAQDGSHPAVCLNWNDAKAYVAWLTKKTGKSYRLLTEAEWEYATRAGTTTRYFFGNDDGEFCRHGNGADESARSTLAKLPNATFASCSDGHTYTSPAGNFLPNGFGLYDVLGNAVQWLEDCWHKNYQEAPPDASPWTTGDCIVRSQRGGSWFNNPKSLRAASRFKSPSAIRASVFGFRVLRTL
jgi:formylglycine-generating enzyme required for sulfatase activity